MQDFIRINNNDNVVVALRDIPAGGEVIKYGYCIGNTTASVKAGQWIHTHNLRTGLGDLLEYTYEPVLVSVRELIVGMKCGGSDGAGCGGSAYGAVYHRAWDALRVSGPYGEDCH